MQKDILFVGAEDRLLLYQDACEDESFHFQVVSNVQSTLESIKEKLPNLILVDHDALGARSIEICQTLKKYPGTQRLPIILVISHENREDLLKALFLPINDYLFLPLDAEDFKLRVAVQLNLLEFKDQQKLMSVEDKIEELEKLLEIFPEYNAARQELSAIYEKTHQIEKALATNLALAKQYYLQNNFGQAMETIASMKNMIGKQSMQFSHHAQLVEALERCHQLLKPTPLMGD